MNFENVKEIVNFVELTITEQADNIANTLVDTVKISNKTTYVYSEKVKLWQILEDDDFYTFMCHYLASTTKIIKMRIEGVQDKRIDGLLKSFDKAPYIKDICARMHGNLKDDTFAATLNSKADFLPIKNGMKVNLRTAEKTQRNKTDCFTFECNVDISKTTKNADSFFSQIMPNKTHREYLRKALGYALTGATSARVFFILYGNGSNGKSLVAKLMQIILGEYYTQCGDAIFQKTAKGGATPELMALKGTRFASYSEGDTADEMQLNISGLKQISGEDRISGRELYKGTSNYDTTCKLFFATNFVPPLGAEKAIVDRLRYIYFDSVFASEPKRGEFKKDDDFVDKLKTIYLDEIFTWVLHGAVAFYENQTIAMPEEFQARTMKMINSEDSIASFIKRCVRKSNNKKDTKRKGELFETYKSFCGDNSQRCQPRSTLFNRLLHLKYETTVLDGYDVYRNISLVEPSDEDVPCAIDDNEAIIAEQKQTIEQLQKQIEELQLKMRTSFKAMPVDDKKKVMKANCDIEQKEVVTKQTVKISGSQIDALFPEECAKPAQKVAQTPIPKINPKVFLKSTTTAKSTPQSDTNGMGFHEID